MREDILRDIADWWQYGYFMQEAVMVIGDTIWAQACLLILFMNLQFLAWAKGVSSPLEVSTPLMLETRVVVECLVCILL
jgi:hypothetical protein